MSTAINLRVSLRARNIVNRYRKGQRFEEDGELRFIPCKSLPVVIYTFVHEFLLSKRMINVRVLLLAAGIRVLLRIRYVESSGPLEGVSA